MRKVNSLSVKTLVERIEIDFGADRRRIVEVLADIAGVSDVAVRKYLMPRSSRGSVQCPESYFRLWCLVIFGMDPIPEDSPGHYDKSTWIAR